MPVDKTFAANAPLTYRSLTHPKAEVQILHLTRTQTQRAYTFGHEMEFHDLKVDHTHTVNEFTINGGH